MLPGGITEFARNAKRYQFRQFALGPCERRPEDIRPEIRRVRFTQAGLREKQFFSRKWGVCTDVY